MQHVNHIDGDVGTVNMVQVENECGLRGDSRDRTRFAERAYADVVPDSLTDRPAVISDSLKPTLRQSLSIKGSDWALKREAGR